ncbi:hypothetical protein C6990_02920 [Nitrosopumilus sp. b3]|uniref:hypothetical protein n=1 Tax=Nitrosopumilus sp. b3 TaxID=2109909 RepID=UPI0015F57277|nr:hypothetical protein [Nitrosopumilus sp. b3]KAF6247818.1 hypothetical protein C6990_02920 [Nitrosopumilus sp. b3]
MKNKTPLVFLLVTTLLLSGNLQLSSAQNLEALAEYSIKLAISPDHLESGTAEHPVGYLYVLSKHGVPITSSYDVPVSLSSDDPTIASVPAKTILKANEEFVSFPIITTEKSGKTTINASLNGKTTFQKIQVGTDETYLPDDLILELNLPTNEMHVNSQMPFSVFLKNADGTIIRAPNDVEIILEYDELLASPDSNLLKIKKGDYYAWGILSSHEKIGNTFVRAIHEESGLDVAKSIEISSTLPTGLKLSVFPKLIPAEYDRTLDIFVTVVDSDGNPTKTHEDIELEFFSNEQFPIGDVLDKISKDETPIIKKGEFGYLLQEKFSLQNLLKNDILIGVSSEGYGTATDTFRTVGESIEEGNKLKRTLQNVFSFGFNVKDYGNTVKVFGLDFIPSNATAFFTYQLSMIEDDEDDDGIRPDGTEIEINPECAEQSDEDTGSSDDVTHNTELSPEEIILYSIDCLEDEELYPMQATETLYADGFIKKVNVISSDDKLAQIIDGGKILSSYSFGTAEISTGQKTGPVTISTSINGVGTGSFTSNVVNTLEQKEVRIFSPTGENSLIFDRDGYFDLFLIALDGKERPKVMKESGKYLITPTNGLVEIAKGTTFTFAQLRSDSFDISVGKSNILLTIEPIGENADLKLEGNKAFTTQPSSQIQISLPLAKINSNHQENLGVIQLVDLQGYPVIPKFNVKSKITSSENSVVQIIDDSIIPAGSSYATFPIKTTGSVGTATISASAKGVNGTSSIINAASSQMQLQIFTGGLVDVVKVDDPIEFKLFVDDENAESVPGASIKIITKGDAVISPEVVRTSSDGSAIVSLTAFEGPNISFDIIATAEGYAEGKDSFTVNVDSPDKTFNGIELELPEWIVYLVIGGILMIGVVVFVFLKKSKADLEEDWEEEEEI